MPITSSTTSEKLWGTVIVLLLAALFAAGNLMPWGRLWAVNHLAFLPVSAAWVFAALIATSLIAIWTVGDTDKPVPASPAHSLLRWLPVIVLIWIAAAYVLRAETALLGDGYLRIDEAERRPPGLLLLTDLLPGLITTSFQQNIGARLTLVRMRQANTVAAEMALREYERRVPEPERIEAATRIRVALDSAAVLH